MCLQAAHVASAQTGVPISVLWAISLTETGRKSNGTFQPWPWTVNMEGKGVWFDTDEEARAYVFKHYKRGARSFDVGCFQINYKWHGENFASIEEMFDPLPNALYAAKFLTDLHNEMGDWSKAAGAYHSRTEKYARKYRKRFNAFRAAYADKMPETPVPPAERQPVQLAAREDPPVRENHFPLLMHSSGSGALGSLVPLSGRQAKPFFGQPRG
ncbi:MAG: transglycosylase SLT domain-containing protein [Pseudomonadota bacterium]